MMIVTIHTPDTILAIPIPDPDTGLPWGGGPTRLELHESAAHGADPAVSPDYIRHWQLESSWRHSGWARQRRACWLALRAAGVAQSRLDRYAQCGCGAWVMQDKHQPSRLRIAASYCRDRWCLPCGRTRARIAAANLRSLVSDRPHRMITLTIRADDRCLADRLDHLYDSYRRLRRSKLWRDSVTAAAAFCEPVWSARSRGWHVHMHIIAAGRYIPHQSLSDAWLVASRDSYIVDLRLLRGHDQALDYVCKYAAKPLTAETIADHDRLTEAVLALQGRRLILTSGAWHGIRLSECTDDTDWVTISPLWRILVDAERGDTYAATVLADLLGGSSCLTMSIDHPSAHPPGG